VSRVSDSQFFHVQYPIFLFPFLTRSCLPHPSSIIITRLPPSLPALPFHHHLVVFSLVSFILSSSAPLPLATTLRAGEYKLTPAPANCAFICTSCPYASRPFSARSVRERALEIIDAFETLSFPKILAVAHHPPPEPVFSSSSCPNAPPVPPSNLLLQCAPDPIADGVLKLTSISLFLPSLFFSSSPSCGVLSSTCFFSRSARAPCYGCRFFLLLPRGLGFFFRWVLFKTPDELRSPSSALLILLRPLKFPII